MELFKEDIEKLVKENLTIEEQKQLCLKFRDKNLKDLNKLRYEFSLNYPNKMNLLDYIVTTPYNEIGTIKQERKNNQTISIAHNKYKELNNAGLIDKSNKFIGVNEDGSIVYGSTLVSVLKKCKTNAYCCATNDNSIMMPGYI